MRTKKPRKVKGPKPVKNKNGFTLIELLVVIGIIGILASVVLVAVNPAKQFAQARNSQRQAAVAAILDAVDQNMVDNNGSFNCASEIQTDQPSQIESAPSPAVDLWSCLVPNYLSALPIDPSSGSFTSDAMYKSGYFIVQNATTGRITVSAPDAELNQTIAITR